MKLLKIFFHLHCQKGLLARVDKGATKRSTRCFLWVKKCVLLCEKNNYGCLTRKNLGKYLEQKRINLVNEL